jgi:pimeloyl-ACP methyl ester carboxylesterase
VLLVEGGGTDASTYRRLVARLVPAFTVHVLERRGRGRSAARPHDYGLPTEVGDITSVIADTGATRVIGHSVGGFFALAAAREMPVERLALFDPAVSVDGLFPADYLPAFAQAAAGDDPKEAMLIAAKGLQNQGSGLPRPLGRALLRLVLLTPEGRTMAGLIDTVPAEAVLAAQADGPAQQWADVTARTRFFFGARAPRYYLPSAQRLVEAMPHADVEVVPRLGHDAIARAPQALVASLSDFLAG